MTVEVPGALTLGGEIAPHANPAGALSVTLTFPVNPLRPETVMVDWAEVPELTGDGEATVILKSWTVNVMVVG